MRRLRYFMIATIFFAALALSAFPKPVHAAFKSNLLIDDVVFTDTNSMSAAQINTFLNGFGTNSCISPNSGFEAVEPAGYSPSGGFSYGNYTTAGQVIWRSAQIYGINPQVLLTTLQKEQSLINSSSSYCNNGDNHKYAAAVGYGCPDSGGRYNYSGISLYRRHGAVASVVGPTCVNSAAKAGFSQQVIRAAWLLRFGQQRSLGNASWAVISGTWNNSDDPATCYGGPMTQGNLQRCQGNAAVYYDGYITIDGVATHMDTGATAALYWYTPHFHGNQNFVSIFESWFGSTVSAGYYSCGANGVTIPGASNGARVLSNSVTPGQPVNLSLALMNNTGSQCVEAHTLAYSLQHWQGHTATNRPSINPDNADVITADVNGDGRDELMTIEYRNTGSGRLEVHIWDATYQRWAAHIASNMGPVDPAKAEVISGDVNGDGRDELLLVQYSNTQSGAIEIHGWTPNLQQWFLHIGTNHSALDKSTARIVAGDMNADGSDELYLVKYNTNDSGRIEVHGWTPSYRQWSMHAATNHAAISLSDGMVIATNHDGVGADDFELVRTGNTGSGRIEVHGWTPNLQQWLFHVPIAP